MEWVGFERSVTGSSQRRYKARCEACHAVMTATGETLRRHKASCQLMEEKIKTLVTKKTEIVKKPPVTLDEVFLKNMGQQERSDYLLGMFVMTSDIDFR